MYVQIPVDEESPVDVWPKIIVGTIREVFHSRVYGFGGN